MNPLADVAHVTGLDLALALFILVVYLSRDASSRGDGCDMGWTERPPTDTIG